METETVVSWREFKEAVATLRKHQSLSTPVLFRGQRSADWELETTLERSGHDEGVMDYYRLILRLKTEIKTATGHDWEENPSVPELEETLRDYDKFSIASMNYPHYAYMAYLRHHGFPSPLLDWSRSPFVAAYFAFRANPSGVPRVAIYAYDERPNSIKTSSSDEPSITRLGPYVAAHRRHFSQQSQYTLCTIWRDSRWTYLPHSSVFDAQDESKNQQDVLRKFVLDIGERDEVLRELADYNLNSYSLFGNEDGLMEALSIREEIAR
ncbi:MAG: FRG domain-containing protein [Afipia sp.]|nr:FRG domain-containing protein [Afipia sp.]